MSILNKIKNDPMVFLSSKMVQFLGKKILIFPSLLIISSQLIWLINIYLVGFVINKIQEEGITEKNIYIILLLLFLIVPIGAVGFVTHLFGKVKLDKLAFLARINYRKYLLKNILDLNLNWHNDKNSGDIIDKVNKSSNHLYQFIRNYFILIHFFIKLISVYIIMVYVNIHLSYVLIIFFIFAYYLIFKFDKHLLPKYKKLNTFENKISEKFFDNISNISTILILKIKKFVLKNMEVEFDKPINLDHERSKLTQIKWFTITMISNLIKIIPVSILIIITYVEGSVIKLGTLTMVYLYSGELQNLLHRLGDMYDPLLTQKAGILNCEKLEKDFVLNKKNKRDSKLKDWNKIEIKDLKFDYKIENEKFKLRIDKFEIKKNKKIAIIGESGSGKTTFLKLLRGLYEKNKCDLLVDGKFHSNNIKSFEKNTMLVPQEPELFSSTILNNITMEISLYNEKYVKKYCDMAQFTSVINNLPKRYQSIINEKGVNLSGGEKQRLALARALLFSKNSEIILLDESTSSVDNYNESKIYKNIFKTFSNKTFISTIHKLNLLKFFDEIYIFKNGKIIDKGTFKELYSRNKKFKKDIDNFKVE